MHRSIVAAVAMFLVLAGQNAAAEPVTPDEAVAALNKAVDFFHDQVADHGGYVWRYSGDLKLREGEGKTDGSAVWVQPPATPTIGEAYLDAYEATGDKRHLRMAGDVAQCLLRGQLHSGGWNYSIEFDPEKRAKQAYRVDLASTGRKPPGAKDNSPAGWEEWKKRKHKGNMTVLDDDTTQAAVRFLMRLDRTLQFKNQEVHEATLYALDSLWRAQYPNGAWSHMYDRWPEAQPEVETYPVIAASLPPTWSRTWTKDWTGCYRLNDRITLDLVKVMLQADDVYGDIRAMASVRKAGDFLLLAQLPDPQPAWAQQYNREMQPVWDRKFEPPAITGLESQDTLETLLLLYRRTGDNKYLKPVPRAIAYLRRLELLGGKLARFYELQTDKPLYFTRDYQLTYSAKEVPKHYGFQVDSRLDKIEAEYQRLLKDGPGERPDAQSKSLAKKVRAIIDQQDERGAWVERGGLDSHEVTPESGVIESRTFADNVHTLAEFLKATPAFAESANHLSAKPRLVVLTDIGGDPDDQQSLIRLLVHANEFDIEALIASASGTPGELKQDLVQPELIRKVVAAYGKVQPNLSLHADGFPTADTLLARIHSGNPHRGQKFIGEEHDTDGSRKLIELADRDDARPLNIAIWGGSTELAQALWRVRNDRTPEELRKFVRKLFVYTIHYQDDTGGWIAEQFPELFYIASMQPAGRDKRESAYRGMYLGGDEKLTSLEWLDEHVRKHHGPLGAMYPARTWTDPNPHSALKEGDTPSWLHFLPVGLNHPGYPERGGWGGRFVRVAGNRFGDSADTVGKVSDPRATVWRWREAVQNEFQARMDWCVAKQDEANHPPQLKSLPTKPSSAPSVSAKPGEAVKLSGSATDPDGDELTYRWFVYQEAGNYPAEVSIAQETSETAELTIPTDLGNRKIHVIVAVTDTGLPPLTRYRRYIVSAKGQ